MTGVHLRDLAAKRGILVGAAVNSRAFKEDETYRATLGREFNCIVAEGVMKFSPLQPERGNFAFGAADSMIDFAEEQGMKVRGHTLVWREALPEWVEHSSFSKQEALDVLRDHIFTVMQHFRGRVFAWDVVNEGINGNKTELRDDSFWYQAIGPDYIEKAFRWAHEADPSALLFYNDYAMDGMTEKADRCYAWVKEMIAREVPIHGVGFQFHVKLDKFPEITDVTRNFKRFNDLGLPVHITELDIWLSREATETALQRQAGAYRDVFKAAVDAANCPAVLLWGFTDRYSWIPKFTKGEYGSALIIDENYKPKPAYKAICEVLNE